MTQPEKIRALEELCRTVVVSLSPLFIPALIAAYFLGNCDRHQAVESAASRATMTQYKPIGNGGVFAAAFGHITEVEEKCTNK